MCLRSVQIIAFDVENPVPSRAIILKRNLRAQLHQLFFGKVFSQTRIQIVRHVCGRIRHRVGQLNHEAFGIVERRSVLSGNSE